MSDEEHANAVEKAEKTARGSMSRYVKVLLVPAVQIGRMAQEAVKRYGKGKDRDLRQVTLQHLFFPAPMYCNLDFSAC